MPTRRVARPGDRLGERGRPDVDQTAGGGRPVLAVGERQPADGASAEIDQHHLVDPVRGEHGQPLLAIVGVDDLDSQRRGPGAVARHAHPARAGRRTGRTRLICAQHGDQATLFRGAPEEEREPLLESWVAADLLPQMRDALPYLVELVGAPGATARQHLFELITVEQHQHRLRGYRRSERARQAWEDLPTHERTFAHASE